MDELEAAAQHCDINNVIIDEDARTVYLADPDMRLDVGSVGKGYAVEMVCQAAEARGLTSALVSVGGNLRAIVLRDGRNGTTACGVEGYRVLIDLPLCRDGHVFGRHGRGNRFVPTGQRNCTHYAGLRHGDYLP